MSHETIYQSLFVQGRGQLRADLHRHLRSGRAARRPRGQHFTTKGRIRDKVMISDSPPPGDGSPPMRTACFVWTSLRRALSLPVTAPGRPKQQGQRRRRTMPAVALRAIKPQTQPDGCSQQLEGPAGREFRGAAPPSRKGGHRLRQQRGRSLKGPHTVGGLHS